MRQYTIIANPASGSLSLDEKQERLKQAASILGCTVRGLETRSAEELKECIREQAANGKVLVIAGGDGTLLDAINAGCESTLAHIPMGTCNVTAGSLGIKGSVIEIAKRIKKGKERSLDLIVRNDGLKSLSFELGMVGESMRLREAYQEAGFAPAASYAMGVANVALTTPPRPPIELELEWGALKVSQPCYVLLTKVSSFGPLTTASGIKADDGFLHGVFAQGRMGAAYAAARSLLLGKSCGSYFTSDKMAVRSDGPIEMSALGTPLRPRYSSTFKLMPKALKMIC